MTAVSVRTESGTPASSSDRGAQQSGPHGRRTRVSDGWSPPACHARTRRARSGRGPCPPDDDACARDRRRCRARRESSASRGSTEARRAASSSDGAIAISSERSGGARRTPARSAVPPSSVVENMPKPPPFHGLNPAVVASVTWAPATASSSETGRRTRHPPRDAAPSSSVTAARRPGSRSRPSCSGSCRTASKRRC